MNDSDWLFPDFLFFPTIAGQRKLLTSPSPLLPYTTLHSYNRHYRSTSSVLRGSYAIPPTDRK